MYLVVELVDGFDVLFTGLDEEVLSEGCLRCHGGVW